MYKPEFEGKVILVTGGTGSIGSQVVRKLLAFNPKQIRVYSRDDSKQYNCRMRLGDDPRIRWLIGDVRDKARLNMAMENVNIVFHAGALKHVLACENDPFEAVKTNVLGTQNVIECALDNNVEKVIGISTDKAADPSSVLGCTKLMSEKLMSAVHHYKGDKKTKFCFVRFGNVIGTRGSVVPIFCWQIKNGLPVTVTDPSMRRFFMTVDDAVSLIFKAAALVKDREIFILKMPILKIVDLAQAVIDIYGPQCGRDPASVEIKIIGRKNGERTHEKLLGRDECLNALETPDMFILKPFIAEADKELAVHEYPETAKVIAKEYSTETEGFDPIPLEQIKELLASSLEYIEERRV